MVKRTLVLNDLKYMIMCIYSEMDENPSHLFFVNIDNNTE